MGQRRIAAIVVLGVSVAASVAAHPGIYEYWKAGTKRGRSSSPLPGHSRARQPNQDARTPTPPAVVPWSESWFADSALIRRRLSEMTMALTVPMIGQTYPLPRGGGFVCSRAEGDEAPELGGLKCALLCTGPELGGRRRNRFYATDSSPTLTLDRVEWLIVAPRPSARAPWRAFVFALADSLDRLMGHSAWVGPDSMEATWSGKEHKTTLRLCGGSEHVDSLEIECISGRLAGRERRERVP